MADRVSQEGVVTVTTQAPKARVSQEAVVTVTQQTRRARVSQQAVVYVYKPAAPTTTVVWIDS